MAVDVFGTVVAVKAEDHEGEALQQLFEHGDEERLADTLTGGHPFILRHAVHGVDMVETFNTVLVALMHAVHAQVAGLIVGRWSAPLADRKAHGPGLGPAPAVALIAAALTQIVQMGYRERSQIGAGCGK